MADVIRPPQKKAKGVGQQKKCGSCKAVIQFRENSPIWTEYGNTYGRCPCCSAEIFIGRLGRADS